MKNKLPYIVGAILLFLAITNPSPKDFYYYMNGQGSYKTHRAINFIVCSFYVATKDHRFDRPTFTYLGIAGNYIEMP